jgi:hypothetical protein
MLIEIILQFTNLMLILTEELQACVLQFSLHVLV